jgi:hypothetical protein
VGQHAAIRLLATCNATRRGGTLNSMNRSVHDLDRRPGGGLGLALSVSYVECDIPDGSTLRDWRRSHVESPSRQRVWRRMVRRADAGRS